MNCSSVMPSAQGASPTGSRCNLHTTRATHHGRVCSKAHTSIHTRTQPLQARCAHDRQEPCVTDPSQPPKPDTHMKAAARRHVLACTLLTSPICHLLAGSKGALATQNIDDTMVLYVSPEGISTTDGVQGVQGPYTSISAALSAVGSLRQQGGASGPPVVLEVASGKYHERILLTKGLDNITLRAWPQGAAVEVSWQTSEPYQSVLFCEAQDVEVVGLTLRHASKSVANNYGVYVVGQSDLIMQKCDISSSTGTGVGVEGASPTFVDCRVHDCARHGIASFGPLDPLDSPPGGGTLLNCQLVSNAGDGVLVRDGAEPTVKDCKIQDNKGWGISTQFAGGSFVGNTVMSNLRGAVQAQGVDLASLQRDNSLTGAVEVRV